MGGALSDEVVKEFYWCILYGAISIMPSPRGVICCALDIAISTRYKYYTLLQSGV